MIRYIFFFFFFNDTATTEIYTLSLHDALPISGRSDGDPPRPGEIGSWSAGVFARTDGASSRRRVAAGRDARRLRARRPRSFPTAGFFCLFLFSAGAGGAPRPFLAPHPIRGCCPRTSRGGSGE